MEPKYVTISLINKAIKNVIDVQPFLQKVYLKGEISNYKGHTRGHLYFSLKDETSKINAVMFASAASKLTFVPQDGMNVLVEGRISVYEASGSYQVYVEKMSEDGIGNLYLEYEKLKKKLEAEGLFAEDHKKIIPKYPKTIGIITAPTGAAVRDIISTIKRRYPLAQTILFPTLVQGELAKDNIVKQIETAQDYDLDLIICGRGGGSIEDLWAFNEECVARAIYASKIPIISAVGHEPDFTIADFVADLRAPTPTGAAEMAVPNLVDLQTILKQYEIRLNENITNKIASFNKQLDSIKTSYIIKNPLAIYEVKEQKLDNLMTNLNSYIKNLINNKKMQYKNILNKYIIQNPESIYEKKAYQFELIVNKVKLLNPLGILEKGYSVVKKDDKIINNEQMLKVNDLIDIKMFKGNVKAKVTDIEKE